MIPMNMKEMEPHTNLIFKFVEFVLNNPITLFIIGAGLTIVPALGIMYVHSPKDDKSNGH
jgi:hypothetical protein